MEKLFLSRFFSYYKLYVIDEQDIDGPVFVAQPCHGGSITGTDRFDDFVCELLTGDVEDPLGRTHLQNIVADRMHQVRFAKSRASVEEEGIIGISGRFGHSDTG